MVTGYNILNILVVSGFKENLKVYYELMYTWK